MTAKKISIFAAIWSQNLWDELILKNEINLLKHEFGEKTKFFVFTYDKTDIFFTDKNVKYKEYFPIWIKDKKNIFRNIFNFFSLLNTVRKSDYIVVWWGWIIFDKENQSTRNPLDLWIFRTKIFRFFRKKIYFFRLWIDIREEKNLKKLKKIFKKYYKLAVRDKNSQNILEKIWVKAKVSIDPVFYDDGVRYFKKDFCVKKVKSFDFSYKDLEEFDFYQKIVWVSLRSGYLEPKSNISERLEEWKVREIITFLQKNEQKLYFFLIVFTKQT